jgi:BASS family bile acid:Na+ symporter
METINNKVIKGIRAFEHLVHGNFVWFLLACYVIAVFVPAPGQALRELSLGKLNWIDGSSLNLSLPLLMLSFLLFNAGLGVKTSELKNIIHKPTLLIVGLLANLGIPIIFTFVVSKLMHLWHDSLEVQYILIGLALISSMPIAGSSTAWSQNSNGNLSLSLGLVLLSTMLSPITTPFALHLVGFMAEGNFAHDLHELAASGTNAFLIVSVVLPSLVGIALHYTFGEKKLEQIKPFLKTLNLLNLLILVYSNAAVALPQAIKHPDLDFLFLILGLTFTLCILAFAAGWAISKFFKAEDPEKSSLMFGLGMNNNGTGLVLASMSLAQYPAVMLPIIFYNLAQQLVAGVVDSLMPSEED